MGINLNYNEYNNKSNWYLPGAFKFFNLYKLLIKTADLNSEILKKNVKIAGVYGAPSTAKWNGGRNEEYYEDNIEEIADFYYSYGIEVCLTFTNPSIGTPDLKDTYCNRLLKAFANKGNKIIINSRRLKDYISEKYPDYTFILSTTLLIKDINDFISELPNYDKGILDISLNNTDLSVIPEQFREKVEILVNEECPKNCPVRKEHYLYASKLYTNKQEIDNRCKLLSKLSWDNFYKDKDWLKNNSGYVFNEEINSYLTLGINNFKIQGRDHGFDSILESLFEYVLNSDYRRSFSRYLKVNMNKEEIVSTGQILDIPGISDILNTLQNDSNNR